MKTAASPRANRLTELRDLVSIGILNQISDRNDLIQLAIEQGTFISEVKAKEYTKSSIYRYLDSLRFLGFDYSPTIGDPIMWSRIAVDLCGLSIDTRYTNRLSEPEQILFRNAIFNSKANSAFLSCFMIGETLPSSLSQFADHGQPLYVFRQSGKLDATLAPNGVTSKQIQLALGENSDSTIFRDEQEFLYTYRLWCLDCGLIDELNVKEARRNGIPERHTYVLYPIASGTPLNSESMLDALYRITSRPKVPVTVSIVWLLYRICIEYRVSVAHFLELLLDVAKSYRRVVHLQRGAGILVQGNFSSSERRYQERYGNHRYYPLVDGTLRTTITLFPKEQQ